MSGRATVETWSGKDRGDENFPVGSLLIRRDLRAHVHAFYAFARNADDIADSAGCRRTTRSRGSTRWRTCCSAGATPARPVRCVCAPAWRRPA